jgi:hypothetical protein
MSVKGGGRAGSFLRSSVNRNISLDDIIPLIQALSCLCAQKSPFISPWKKGFQNEVVYDILFQKVSQ